MATRPRSQLNAVGGHSSMNVRRCPTLPQGRPCSTIGAASLSFRVRNVSGRFPRAMAAETLGPAHPVRGCGGGLGDPDQDPGVCCRGCGGVCCCSVVLVGFPSVGNHRVDAGNLGPRTPALQRSVCSDCQVIGVLVPVSCTPCGASTSGLSTQSSGWEPLPPKGMEISS
jgi:hypothetical protein